MIKFTTHTTGTAPADSRPLLDAIERGLGFVPNLYRVIAESPAALQGALAVANAFANCSLSSVEQQLVALAVSESNRCEYCVAAHSTFAKRVAKADAAWVNAARRRERLPNTKQEALVVFTRKVVEQRGLVAEADVTAFVDAGYTEAQIIDVLLGVSMKTLNNYVDHIAHPRLDDEFEAEAWQPQQKVA
jgi:uncharacterized peroxidase-related enzyme